jgi:hypothetical protein
MRKPEAAYSRANDQIRSDTSGQFLFIRLFLLPFDPLMALRFETLNDLIHNSCGGLDFLLV